MISHLKYKIKIQTEFFISIIISLNKILIFKFLFLKMKNVCIYLTVHIQEKYMFIDYYFFRLFLVRCRGISVVVPNSPLVEDPGIGC